MTSPSKLTLVLVLALTLSGCNAGIGTAGDLPTVRMDYNEAIVRSSNEQLLLNLVRLRYLHAPQFFEVTSVTTQSWMTSGGSIGVGGSAGGLGGDAVSGSLSPSLGGSWSLSNRPTVSYSPLQGEAFAQRMVRPIRPETLFSLVNVGWRIDRLFACCVTRVNDMTAPVIASSADDFEAARFRRLSEILFELQLRGALEVGLLQVGDGRELRMTFIPTDDRGRTHEMIREVRGLLNLDPTLRSYRILAYHPPPTSTPPVPSPAVQSPAAEEVAPSTDASSAGSPAPSVAPSPAPVAPPQQGTDHVVVRSRSLLGALFYLSHGVGVPSGSNSARSLDYNDLDGQPIRVANPVPGALISISATPDAPTGSYVRTWYDGTWYSIPDDDLQSKQIFLLLQVLFSVLSSSDNAAPVLTIPLGG